MTFFLCSTKASAMPRIWAAIVAVSNAFRPLPIALNYGISCKKLLAAVLLSQPASRIVQPRENLRIYVAS